MMLKTREFLGYVVGLSDYNYYYYYHNFRMGTKSLMKGFKEWVTTSSLYQLIQVEM